MKTLFVRFSLVFATVLLALPLWTVSRASDETGAKNFTGEVTDSICANSGSHNEMMAKMQRMGRDKETCTKQCAQLGAKYVLYDEGSKAVYTLDDQGKVEKFAGRRVRVAGTLAGNQIRVTNVEAVA